MLIILLIVIVVIVIVSVLVVSLNMPFDKDNYKKCQFCRKTIKIESATCRYCKKYLL